MKITALLLVLLLGAQVGCSRLDPLSVRERETAALSVLRLELDAAVNAGDAERVAGLFTVDSVYLPPGVQEVVGRPALLAYLQAAYGSSISAPRSHRVPSDVKVAGDWACEWGQVEASGAPAKGVTSRINGKYLHVYQRLPNGHWQIARASYNANPPQPVRVAGN